MFSFWVSHPVRLAAKSIFADVATSLGFADWLAPSIPSFEDPSPPSLHQCPASVRTPSPSAVSGRLRLGPSCPSTTRLTASPSAQTSDTTPAPQMCTKLTSPKPSPVVTPPTSPRDPQPPPLPCPTPNPVGDPLILPPNPSPSNLLTTAAQTAPAVPLGHCGDARPRPPGFPLRGPSVCAQHNS